MLEGDARIKRFYLFRAVTAFSVWMPFWTLWVYGNLESVFLITVVDVAFWVTMIGFQIPAGLLGDRYGRKKVLFLGEALFAVGVLSFGLSTEFYQFVIANIVWALGACFIVSGDTPFLYDTLIELKREREFMKIMGTANAVMFMVNAVACVVGGYIAYSTEHINLTLIVAALVSLMGTSTILLLKEPKVKRAEFASYRTQFKHGFRHVFTTRAILVLVLFQILLQVAVYVMAVFRSVYLFEDLELSLFWIGISYASFAIVGVIVVRKASSFEELAGEKGALMFMYASMFTSFIVIFLIQSPVVIVMQYLIYAVSDLQSPIIGGYINRRVDSDHRSTVVSISNFMFTAVLVAIEVSAGWAATEWGVRSSLLILALCTAPVGMYLLRLWSRIVDAEKAARTAAETPAAASN